MIIKQQVLGLNKFLTKVFNADMRLSVLLTDLKFTDDQIELLRDHYLESLVNSFLQSIQKRMIAFHDGERLHKIITRRFGLDGETPDTLRYLGERFGVSGERIRQLECKALKRWKAKSNQDYIKTNLFTITNNLIGEIRETEENNSILGTF